MHRLQYAQRQSGPARSAHEFDPQTEATEVAFVCSDHVCCSAARSLEALRRSGVLERRAERLSSMNDGRPRRRALSILLWGQEKRQFSQIADRLATDPKAGKVLIG